VTAAIDAFPDDFTLTDLERACPGVSRDMVRRVLVDLRRSGKVTCLGRRSRSRLAEKGQYLHKEVIEEVMAPIPLMSWLSPTRGS
jgi:hypothetical protein